MSTLLWPHYEVEELRTMRDVKESFPLNRADHLNWLFCGSSGIHGTYRTLDEIEEIIRGDNPETSALDNGKYYATVLVVHPRLCVLKYGEIQVGLPDVALLRRLVATTIDEVAKSQKGNT